MYVTLTVYPCTRHKKPPLFRDENLRHHLEEPHYLCSCQQWFTGIKVHLAQPGARDHKIVETATGLAGPPQQIREWHQDPPPPLPPPIVRRPHVAYRCWRVFPQLPVLMPLTDSTDGTEWLPGRDHLEAKCREVTAGKLKQHHVPHAGCHCGYWGLKDLWDAIGRNSPSSGGIAFLHQKADLAVRLIEKIPNAQMPLLVAGAIDMYGLVTPGTKGWRSQFASVLALWFVPNITIDQDVQLRLVAALCDMYEVPVVQKWQDLAALVEQRRADYLLADAVGPEETPRAGAEMLQGRLSEILTQPTSPPLEPIGSLPPQLTRDQAAFVDGVICRLEKGSGLSEADVLEVRNAAKMLGLAWAM